MKEHNILRRLFFVVIAILSSACATKEFTYYSDTEIEEAFRSGATVVELNENSPDHVAGRFRTVDVDYRFSSESSGDRVTMSFAQGGETALVAQWTQELLILDIGDDRIRFPIRDRAVILDTDPNPQSNASVHAFAQSDIYRSLPRLSRALAMLGVTGTSHPASLALHRTALAAATIHEDITSGPTGNGSDPDWVPLMYANPRLTSQIPTIGINDFDLVDDILGCDTLAGPILPPEYVEAIAGKCVVGGGQCQDLQDDPNGDDCDGMCGKKCSCWRWVCGDCCAYAGCQIHDDLTGDCLEGGFSGTEILSCPLAGAFFPVVPFTSILACGFSF